MQDVFAFPPGSAPRLVPCRWILATAIVAGGSIACSLRAADTPPSDEPPTIRLTISPSAEPVPALKYRLLPALRELKHGNAALAYDRAIITFPTSRVSGIPRQKTFLNETLEHWLEMSIAELPQKEVEKQLDVFHAWTQGVERGALLDHCDWGLPLEQDGFATLLPEIQETRLLARMTALKGRLEVARGQFDEALRTFAANFKLSRNLCEGRILITCFVGAAVGNATDDQLETFVQRPGAPNLYWALTELPAPWIDMRTAIETENMMLDYQFPELKQFKKGPMSREEASRLNDSLLANWARFNSALGKLGGDVRVQFAAEAMRDYSDSKRTLVEAGWKKSDVDAMPVAQALWLASYRRIEVLRDEVAKWVETPPTERRAGMERIERRLSQNRTGNPFELTDLMYAGGAAFEAATRMERRFALLRVVEALRLYAHTHQANLPDRLELIGDVPIPNDPTTGKPFIYRLDGATAVLETAPGPNNRYHGRRYLINVRK